MSKETEEGAAGAEWSSKYKSSELSSELDDDDDGDVKNGYANGVARVVVVEEDPAVTSRDPHLMLDPWQEQLSGQGKESLPSLDVSEDDSLSNTGT